jgi:hypothetical protein
LSDRLKLAISRLTNVGDVRPKKDIGLENALADSILAACFRLTASEQAPGM